MRGERSFDFHYFSHNSREFCSIDASETYDFRIFLSSRPINFLESFTQKTNLFDASETYDSRIFCSSYLLNTMMSFTFKWILSMHPKRATFKYAFFPHFLNHDDVLLSNESIFFRCNWNLEHSFVPILKTCRWIFSSILESFSLKRTFSIHLKHTTSGYSFLPIFWITMMFYSQTNPYSFDTFETYDFRIYSFFPILRTMTNIFLALSRILISNESTFFRCIFFQKIFSIHIPRIFFLAPSNQTHISIHLSLESGRQPAKLSVVAVSTSRNASCLS